MLSLIKVNISWPSGTHKFNIDTPWRKATITRLARRNMQSFSSTIANESVTAGPVLNQFAANIRKEMKLICSDEHNSIIRNATDGNKIFKWDHLFSELSSCMPAFVSLLLSIIPKGKNDERRIMLVCVIISMILKWRFPKISLLQRAISVLLYGNGCSKQVNINNMSILYVT